MNKDVNRTSESCNQ